MVNCLYVFRTSYSLKFRGCKDIYILRDIKRVNSSSDFRNYKWGIKCNRSYKQCIGIETKFSDKKSRKLGRKFKQLLNEEYLFKQIRETIVIIA